MEKHDLNDPPPSYYACDLDIEPPLKPDKGEVYVIGPGPHYFPQYPPPVDGPQITELSKPPSSEKRRCCKSNARCYGGSGGLLLVFALLALAIWLGFRFGTQLVKVTLPDNIEGDDDDHMNKNPPLINTDKCLNDANVQCDGKKDCHLGIDEANCVRFSSTGLQVKTAKDHRFLPVCYKGWNQGYSDKTCAQLGFQKSSSTKSIKLAEESIGLVVNEKSSPFIQGILEVSSSCSDQETVSLQCVDCGRQQSTSRIVGGSKAVLGRWPWQVSLQENENHICGGVLISKNFVLSAAHCFEGTHTSPKYWMVHGGVVSLETPALSYKVKKIILHQNYNTLTHDNDIAILQLESSVDFNENVLPACLPTSGKEIAAGTRCWTSGFGSTQQLLGTLSNILMETNVDIIGEQMCNSPRMYNGLVTENMICAGYEDGGKDACQGDSGGPLVCEEDNVWSLIGLTSWGQGCGIANRPGVYTKITRYLPWIYQTMQVIIDGVEVNGVEKHV